MRSNKGFSLVELIVVIAIMAIIAGVAIPVYTNYITKANDAVIDQLVADAQYAADLAFAEYGVTVLVEETTDGVSLSVAEADQANANALVALQQVAGIVGATTTDATPTETSTYTKAAK